MRPTLQIFTKHLESRAKIDQLVNLFSCSFRDGRPEGAPAVRKDPPSHAEINAVDRQVPHDPTRLPHQFLLEDIAKLFPAAEVDPPRRGEDDARPGDELADPVPEIEAQRNLARRAIDNNKTQRQQKFNDNRTRLARRNANNKDVEMHLMECAEYGEEASDRRLCEEPSLQARCTPPDRGNASQVIGGRGVTVWCAELSSGPVWRRSAAEVKHGVLATLVGAPSAGNAAPTHEQTCSARMAADTTAAVANNSDSNNVCVACPSNSASEMLADVTTTTSALLEVMVRGERHQR